MDKIDGAVTKRLPEGQAGELARGIWKRIAEALRPSGLEGVGAVLEALVAEAAAENPEDDASLSANRVAENDGSDDDRDLLAVP